MKNIILSPAYPLRGGIASFGEALCRAFNKKEKKSEIVSFYYQYPGILFPGKTQLAEGPPPKDIKITPVISSINPFSWNRAVKNIRHIAPDYIIVQYWMPFMAPAFGWICNRVRKRSEIKIISIAHNIKPHEQGFLDQLLSRYFFNSCDGFITLSASSLSELKNLKPEIPADYIPHPVYDHYGERVTRKKALEQLHLPEEPHYLLFFGLIRKYKGLDILYRALANKMLDDFNIKLIVAGEWYEDKEGYDKLAKELGIENKLIVRDVFIPNDQVNFYFSVADMVIQPYRTATQSGITQIAYHFNIPMLVTRVGGLAEIVPDQKVGYVTSVDPESIAKAISDFYRNEKKEFFEGNIKEEKKRFTWEAMVEGIEELVNSLKRD